MHVSSRRCSLPVVKIAATKNPQSNRSLSIDSPSAIRSYVPLGKGSVLCGFQAFGRAFRGLQELGKL